MRRATTRCGQRVARQRPNRSNPVAAGTLLALGNSEGGSAPLPNLPPGTGCAGRAGARSGTSTGRGMFSRRGVYSVLLLGLGWALLQAGCASAPPAPQPISPEAASARALLERRWEEF